MKTFNPGDTVTFSQPVIRRAGHGAGARGTVVDAQLIAAAPEMLRALQRLTHPAADDDDLAYAQSIIKKALGKA